MKGQAALEYLIIIGALLLIIMPIFYFTITKSSENIKINEINDAIQSIARKSDSIYVLGEGSRDFIWITIPKGIEYTLVGNKTILAHGSPFGDIDSITKGEVTGTIPIIPGTYKIRIEMLDEKIFIGPINDTEPPKIIATTPNGIIGSTNPIMTATTNEAAICRYDTTDKDYTQMQNAFSGVGISHTKQLTNLAQGQHTYYARCIDSFNNIMTTSTVILFTITSDTTPPIITQTNATPKSIVAGNNICINAKATDNLQIDKVWTIIETPLHSPFIGTQEYLLQDNSNGCDNSAGDGIYGAAINMQVVGTNIIITTYANDTSGNKASQTPDPNIAVNVVSGPGQGFTYIMPNNAWYYKTPNDLGITTKDSQMATLTDVTLSLTDEDKNTPPSSQRVYHTPVKDIYEGFIIKMDKTKDDYSIITLKLKVKDSDIIPYNIIVYPYDSDGTDGDSIILTNITQGQITEINNPGVNRGYNEFDITKTVKAGKSPKIKIRIAAESTIDKKIMHIVEVDIGVA